MPWWLHGALGLALAAASPATAAMVDPLDPTWTGAPIKSIYAYVWPPSVVAGDTLSIFVCSKSPTVGIRFQRVGASETYVYDGTGAHHPHTPAGHQLVTDAAGVNVGVSSTGCGWAPTLRVVVPADWVSAAYYVEVWPEDGEPSFMRQQVPFFVRNPQPTHPILVVPSTSTCFAYQAWGGRSLYDKLSADRTNMASLERPADTNDGRGQFAQFDLPWVRFLALSGVEADYATMEDIHVQGLALLSAYQEVVFTGHSEYWSESQRDAVEAYIASGGNVFFATGNTCWWRTEYSTDMRQLICYKGDNISDADGGTRGILPGQQYLYGPTGPHPLHPGTYNWRLPPANRGAYSLTGLDWGDATQASLDSDGQGTPTDWTVRDSTHWAFANTGLAKGAKLGATHLPGDEVDGAKLTWFGDPSTADGRPTLMADAYARGTPWSFAIAATCEANPYGTSHPVSPCWGVMGGYQQPGQGAVFTMPYRHLGDDLWYYVGTTGNPVVRQVVLNIIRHLESPVPQELGVGRPGAPPAGLHVTEWPNPVARVRAEGAELTVTLPRSSRYSLDVVSLEGERVHRAAGELHAGESRLGWRFPESLASGIYFWDLRTDAGNASGKVVWIR